MPVKDNIRIIRELKNKSVIKLAKESGLSKQSIYAWENGDYGPGKENLDALAKALDVTVKDFYDDDKWTKTLENKGASIGTEDEMKNDIYKNLVEGNTEYILIPRSVLNERYRLVAIEQIQKDQVFMDGQHETIMKLLDKIDQLNANPAKVQKSK